MKSNELNKTSYNWLFIPGGPGLNDKCFSLLTEKISTSRQNKVHYFKYPARNPDIDDKKYFEEIQLILIEQILTLDNVILVGHSFGGMLLQVISLSNLNINKVILLNSSPSLKCFEIVEKKFFNFTTLEKEEINKAELEYSIAKSNKTFLNLFKSWAPYYVTPDLNHKYFEMVENCIDDFKLYEWANKFFYKYFETESNLNHSFIIINSATDKICPMSLFESKNYKNTKYTIVSNSHFPWLDSPDELINILNKIIIM